MGNDLAIFLILDGSGSMGHLQNDVVEATNEFIRDQKQIKQDTGDDTTFTLTVFDSNFTQPYVAEDIELVNEVDKSVTYLGGGTALLDAVGKTLSVAENQNYSGKKLVAIYTDGAENTSSEYTYDQIKELIERLDADDDWTVVFMSAGVDNFRDAQKMGVAAGNYMTADTGVGSTRSNITSLSKSSTLYRNSAGKTDSFMEDFDVKGLIDEEDKKNK